MYKMTGYYDDCECKHQNKNIKRKKTKKKVIHFADQTQDSEYGDSYVPICCPHGRGTDPSQASYFEQEVTCKNCLKKIGFKMVAKKKSVPKKAVKKVAKKIVKEAKGPKAGDTVSMAFHYAGLVSWESYTIDKVAKGSEVVWIDNQLYEGKEDGTYVYEDYTLGPCKKVLHLDGGKRADEDEEKDE